VLLTRVRLASRGIGDPLTPFLNSTRTVLFRLAPYGLDLAYISLVALLLPTKRLGGLLRKMAPAGRMAFSNYILHSLLPAILFPLLFEPPRVQRRTTSRPRGFSSSSASFLPGGSNDSASARSSGFGGR
jgi:hypothetical protein